MSGYCALAKFSLTILIGGAAISAGPTVLAQPADQSASPGSDGLEEVVVTARRREEKLQQIPLAVTVYSGAALEAEEVRTAEQLSHLVSSFSLNGPFGNADITNIRLRGMPGVATYFAEVPTTLNGNAIFVDLENVQVLKGPQGVSFGVNTTGGAILLEPKRPTETFGGYAELTLGDYDRHEIEAAVNVPVIDDKLLVRLAVDRNERDGYTHVISLDKDFSNLDYWYARGSITVRPADNIENYIVADYYFSDDNGPGIILTAVNPKLAGAILPKLNTDLVEQQALGVRTELGVDPGLNPIDKQQTWRVIDIAKWDMTDAVTLKNIASYSLTQALQRVDLDGSPENAISSIGGHGWGSGGGSSGTPSNTEVYTEEFQLSGKALDNAFEWVSGGFLSFTHAAGPAEVTSSVFGGLSYTTSYFPTDHGSASRTQGIYAQGIYDLGNLTSVLDGLKFTGGYRYNWNWQTLTTIQRNQKGVCTTLGADSNCVSVLDSPFQGVGWTLALDYQLLPDTLVYVRSSRGYTSGGFNQGSVPQFQTYKPEHATDVELGVKSDWQLMGVRARTNADLFHVDYTDIQTRANAVFTNASGALQVGTITNNAAAATLEGAELEMTVVPIDSVELTGNYSVISSKYNTYISVDPATLKPIDLSGQSFTNFPRTQFNVTGRYRLPLDAAIGEVSISATYSRQTSVYFGTSQTEVRALEPGYDNLNMRVDWKDIFGQPLDADFFMTNVTDNVHRLGSFTIYSSVGVVGDLYNEPRMYGFQARYHF